MTKRFDLTKVDALFALVGDGRRWFIPAAVVESRTSLDLGGPKYSEFEIERGGQIIDLVYGDPPGGSKIEGGSRGSFGVGEPSGSVKAVPKAEWVRIPPPPLPSARASGEQRSERKLGRAGQAIVRGKRQMTIPAQPYLEAGLDIGDRIRFRADGPGRVIMERIDPTATIFDPA